MRASVPIRPVRRLLPLLLLATPLAAAADEAPAARRAPEGRLRVGVEGGAAWYNAFPTEALGPAGLVRVRGQLTSRVVANVALAHLRQPLDRGGELATTLVPITLDLRLDRTPIAPYVGGGVAVLRVAGLDRLEFGGVFQAGLEWGFTETWALSAQATYAGIGAAPDIFPFFSSATLGFSAAIF